MLKNMKIKYTEKYCAAEIIFKRINTNIYRDNNHNGLSKLPDFNLYWKTDDFWYNSFIANKMSLNMFKEIKKYIHLSDPNKEYEKNDRRYNPLQKINPIWDKIMGNC